MSNGLDDSLFISKFSNKNEIIKKLIDEIGEDFFYKNLNNKNIGNCDTYTFYKNSYIDFNDLGVVLSFLRPVLKGTIEPVLKG